MKLKEKFLLLIQPHCFGDIQVYSLTAIILRFQQVHKYPKFWTSLEPDNNSSIYVCTCDTQSLPISLLLKQTMVRLSGFRLRIYDLSFWYYSPITSYYFPLKCFQRLYCKNECIPTAQAHSIIFCRKLVMSWKFISHFSSSSLTQQ